MTYTEVDKKNCQFQIRDFNFHKPKYKKRAKKREELKEENIHQEIQCWCE